MKTRTMPAIADLGRFAAKTSVLSSFQVMNSIPLVAVLKALSAEKISFVVVGAHGLATWTKAPRATEDVDVVVAARHQEKAVRALLASFPHLQADDREVVIRLSDPVTSNVAIDVMKTNQPLYQAAFKNAVALELQKQPYRVPTLEMALAMKFASMVSLMRQGAKKHLDAHDFITMIEANPEIDLEKLAQLGELVYPGGGKELFDKVRQVRNHEKLIL